MKKLWQNKNISSFLELLTSLFLLEIIFKLIMKINILDYSLIRILIGIGMFSSIITILTSFIKKETTSIINVLIILIWSVIFLVQAGFNNYLGTYMSIGASSQAGAVGGFLADFIGSFNPTFYFLFIPIVLYIIYLIFLKPRLNKHFNQEKTEDKPKKISAKKQEELKRNQEMEAKKLSQKTQVALLIVFLISYSLYIATLYIPFMQNDLQMVSNKELYKNPSMPNIAVSQFGITGFEIADIKAFILKTSNQTTEFKKEEQEITDYSRVIDDTAWEELQSTETNKYYKQLNNYFMSKEITPKNPYTGMFEGKNLIVIMMESGSNVLTDYPEYFPNINKLYNEGWAFTNAFSPRNACSTGNNEMSGLTSLYTINRSCTANVYKANEYFEAMFNLFNYQGYTTSSYHDYTDHFYYRHTIHPNMGSGKFYGVADLGIKLGSGYQPWPSDVEFIEKSVPNFINEDNFMVWLTTVSSHMSYLKSSVTGDMYLDLYSDQSWNTNAKRYMSKLKILDNAIGTLLEELEKANKLEDTVIVLFADHYPYGLSTPDFSSLAKYDVEDYGDIDRTPFIIYNPLLTPTKYEQYTTYMNILPTIANLFNLDYDPRLYGGEDLFSENYFNKVVFADGSWRSDIAYYDAPSGKISYIGEEKYTNEEILEINNKIINEMKMNNLAIEKNYFKYLNDNLNKELINDNTLE